MKSLKSENADISYILQHKLITPRKLRNVNGKTKVIHGWDIKLLYLAQVFFEKEPFLLTKLAAKVNYTNARNNK